jgi:Tfp pilus assembly protein PilN
VKPIHINLAARPFRDYRPVYAVVVLTALLTAFLALNNIDTFLRYRTETKTTRANIAKLEEDITSEQRRAETVTQRLRGVDIKLLASQTEFANEQLAERAFSWSELLDRLERILPADVRLQSVVPNFGKDGTVHLSMTCATKTGEGLTNTINRFNGDHQFTNAFPATETHLETGDYRFTLGVDYRPSIARRVE